VPAFLERRLIGLLQEHGLFHPDRQHRGWRLFRLAGLDFYPAHASMVRTSIIADAIDPEGSLFSHAVLPGPFIDCRYFRLTFPDGGKGKDLLA